MKCIWYSGPPPYVGWWNASMYQLPAVWRWWDGNCWSKEADPSLHGDDAQRCAQVPDSCLSRPVLWTKHWPKNARVPRVKP